MKSSQKLTHERLVSFLSTPVYFNVLVVPYNFRVKLFLKQLKELHVALIAMLAREQYECMRVS